MPDPEDVIQPDSSTGADAEAQEEVIQPDVTLPNDRPAINLKAEFDRKFAQQEAVNQQILMALQSLQPQRAPAQPAQTGTLHDYSDRQLQELAAAGSGDAQALLAERTAQRVASQQLAQYEKQRVTQAQLQVLYGRYPLHDQTHPITQAAMRTKAVMLQAGWANGPDTDLEAIRTAIADNPDLVAQHVTRRPATPAVTRQDQVSRQSAVPGATPRQAAPRPANPVTKVTPKEAQIANRMGVKDPGKAKERQEQRMKEGRSSLSPTLVMAIREQEQG